MSEVQQLWGFCGPNGAGKSTLAERFLKGRLPIVNPDVIAQSLPKRTDGSLQELEAGRIALRARQENLAAGLSFVFETTLSGRTELQTIQCASAAGYKVNIVFVGLESAERSVWRVGTRVSKGGHDVPEDAIRRRYERAMKNLEIAVESADRVIVFDNSGSRHRLLLVSEYGLVRHHAELPAWAKKWLPAKYQLKEQGT